jgi:hypothetical protein
VGTDRLSPHRSGVKSARVPGTVWRLNFSRGWSDTPMVERNLRGLPVTSTSPSPSDSAWLGGKRPDHRVFEPVHVHGGRRFRLRRDGEREGAPQPAISAFAFELDPATSLPVPCTEAKSRCSSTSV